MLKLILAKFWPTIIPSIIYFLWLLYIKKKFKAAKNKSTKKQLIITIWATIIVTIICMASYFYFAENSGQTYIPSKFEDGKFVPGRME